MIQNESNRSSEFNNQQSSVEVNDVMKVLACDSEKKMGMDSGLKLTEQQYRILVNSLPAAVYTCDKDGNITFFNSIAERFWGYTPDIHDSSIKFCACFKVWSLDGKLIPPEETPMAISIATGRAFRNAEAIVERPDGSKFYASVNIDPIFDDDGTFAGAVNVFQDISDLKEKEQKLLQSSRAFERMIDNLPAKVWITDKEARCNFLNSQWYAYTGQIREEAQGFGWLQAIHPDDRDHTARIWLEANEHKKGFTQLYRLRTKDGEYRWNVDSGEPLFDQYGKFEGYIGSVIDVHEERTATEKIKEAQQELRETLQKLRIATESADVGTWSLNPATGKLDWSNIHKRLWGYDEGRNDLTYEDWHSIILPEDKAEAFRMVTLAEKEKTQYENLYRIRRVNDGEIRWMRSVGQYFYDEQGKPITLTGISIDVTDQKTVEERFRSLAETLPQLVWMTDAKGNFVYASGKWQNYSMVDPRSEGAWEKVIHPDDNIKVMEAWQRCLSTGEPFVVEARLRDRHGNYRWHFGKADPLRNEENTITNWIGAYSDIHEHRMHQENLQNLVTERTKELAYVNQQLAEKNAALERSNQDLQQFAYVASHDLKEPLRKVRIFADRIGSDQGTVLSENSRTFLDKIVRAATRMTNLIEGVLGYSTFETRISMNQTVDLNEILKAILSDLELPIQQKNAVVKISELPAVRGSQVLLSQMFFNLVNNALKFSRPDCPPLIEVTAQNDSAAVTICVADNGIGFDQRYATNIFDTFTRLNPKDQYEGTGLGLSLCRKIAERHQGKIWAEGTPGKGAKFFVSFPRPTV